MTPELTGAERYLASRMNNRDYREAYEAAVTGPMTAQVWDLPTGPECIRFARTRNNMSQRDLAAEVGVGYPHISKIETGKERPSQDLCHKIASCLNVSGDRLAAMFGYLPDWADELLRTHPSGTLTILARFANSIIDGDGE